MAASSTRLEKWDWIVRITHWTMVILLVASWFAADNGEMQIHYYCGYALITVVIFRIIWGIIGTKQARFSYFLTSPKKVWLYLKTVKQSKEGDDTHSPAGGYSVVALLSLMVFQLVTGLFAVETDGFDGGPLSESIDYDLSLAISEIHQTSFDVLLGFIALHIAAVIFYQTVLGKKLIQRMSIFK